LNATVAVTSATLPATKIGSRTPLVATQISKTGRLSITVLSKRAIQVTVKLTSPATAKYATYSVTKQYLVN